MKVLGVIPLRGGSVSIPLKNIKELCDKPLAQWVVDEANKSKYIDEVVILTDSKVIANTIKDVRVFWRSPHTATDNATSLSALLEFNETLKEDTGLCLLQATSPLITHDEIDRGIESVITKEYDTALSVTREKRFIWNTNGPVNYDPYKRPRRQDWDGFFAENGGFYVYSSQGMKKHGNFIYGKTALIETKPETSIEIDEQIDWLIIENIIKNRK